MKRSMEERIFFGLAGFGLLVCLALIANIARADKRNEADIQQYQDQEQDQYQGQDQGQKQHQVAVGGEAVATATQTQGNAQNVTFTSPDDITVRNTVSARVPNLVATSPCFYSWSGGLGAAGINIGGGRAKRDPECDKRELARMIAAFGYTGMAMAVACKTEAAIETIGAECAQMVSDTNRVGQLTAENDRLREQLDAERLNCNEAKNRIFEACQEAK